MQTGSHCSESESLDDDAAVIHHTPGKASDVVNLLTPGYLVVDDARPETTKLARHFWSLSTLGQFSIDLVIATPAVFFLVYAYLVWYNDGDQANVEPVPTLRAAARYGPTIFPIAFAAIMANCLKAVSAAGARNHST